MTEVLLFRLQTDITGGKHMANLAQEIRSNDATSDASVAKVDMKLEVVVIPVSDVDRAKEFYKKLGWRLDVTPPGSWCSVQFGKTLTTAARPVRPSAT
ncbi:MAG TPA: hypothetical protein VN950_27430 [Terriglobales bacterium]|nr:hypothetical protein [Terriglobales bacterium]